MAKAVLYPYQEQTIEKVQEGFNKGIASGIVHLFTGAGKTIVAAEMINQLFPLTKHRSLFIAPARSLVHQTAAAFSVQLPELRQNQYMQRGPTSVQVPGIGVVMANVNYPDARVIIGSSQTLIDKEIEAYDPIEKNDTRVDKYGNINLSNNSKRSVLVSARFDQVLANGGLPDFIISDEAHHSVADNSLILIKRLWELCDALSLPRTKLVGMTATPIREDGRALSNLFETIFISRTFRWGIKHGYLAPLEDPIRVMVDLADGDITRIEETANWKELIAKAWFEEGENRPTIAMMPSVQASKDITRYFNELGVPCAHIDGFSCIDKNNEKQHKNYRQDLFDQFMHGDLKVLFNFGVLIEGIDLPPASLLLWGRKGNPVMLTQAIGRILRKFGGNKYLYKKENAKILDITGDDLSIVPIGTLLGYRVIDDKYEEDPDAEDELERLDEGLDLRDLKKENTIHGEDTVYTVSKLLSKTPDDWYHDPHTNMFSLSVSENDSLCVHPPLWTMAETLKRKEREILNQLNSNGNNEELQKLLVTVAEAVSVFGSFTLWHVIGGARSPRLKQKDPITTDAALDIILSDAVIYAFEADDIEVTKSFTNKRASWKNVRNPITPKQLGLLTKLMGRENVDDSISKGEAAQLINHMVTVGPIFKELAERYKNIQEYVR